MCLTSLGWSVGRRSGKDVVTDCGGSWFISRICNRLQYLDWGLWALRLVPQRRAYVITNHSKSPPTELCAVQMLHSSMVVSPSTETNSSSVTQEVPRSLWKTNVHYLLTTALYLPLSCPAYPCLYLTISKQPATCPYPAQHIPVFTSPSHTFKTCFPIVLSSTPNISKLSVFFKFRQQTLFSPPAAKLHPCHPVWFGNPHDIRI